MLIVLEKTEWSGPFPNHIYALSKGRDKMFGYVKHGTSEWQWFKGPRGFDARGRKFLVLEEREDPVTDPSVEQWGIPSSTKGTWTVKREDGQFSCDCPAAKYRRQECKHIQQVKKMLT